MVKRTHSILNQLLKFFARLHGVSTHEAMYSGVNEFEECRIQALTLTKSLNYVEGCYKGLEAGLKAYGHGPTELIYTDNAQAELAFHERTTPSLKQNVSHVVLDPYAHLPALKLPDNFKMCYYDASDLIDAACDSLLSRTGPDMPKLIVGLGLKYVVESDGNGGYISQSEKIDVIQIATGDTVYVFKVTINDLFCVHLSKFLINY
jgi:hypothetical protein